MVTATLVFMSLLLVFVAGEAVRGQCRRMLAHPAESPAPAADAAVAPLGSEVAA
jgi:hypothetical protein